MHEFNRHSPSPAMVIALLALFVALGGTGLAATHLSGGQRDAQTAAKKKRVSELAQDKRFFYTKAQSDGRFLALAERQSRR